MGCCLGTLGVLRKGLAVYANGKASHQGAVALMNDGEVFVIDDVLQRPINGPHKVVAMVGGLKSQEVVPKQPLKQLAAVRACGKGLRVGPRNMPEEGNRKVRAFFFKEFR